MIDCNILLSWMTHIGEGSWVRFRNAVEELAGDDIDLPALCRRIRIRLSDLGFADFFIEDSQQWKMLPPALGGLAAQGSLAILCGSRTPILVETLMTATKVHGCQFDAEYAQDWPMTIHVAGPVEALAAVASQAGVRFFPNLGMSLAGELSPIQRTLHDALKAPVPLNWRVRSFDFNTGAWVEELLPNAACEFTPTYGHARYFVHRKRGKLLRISKRDSLYAAAMLNGVRLVEYDAAAKRLSVPLFAPLPASYSRAACLCSGRAPDIVDGRIEYGSVPPEVGAIVMVAAGQSYPGIESRA